MLKNVYGKGFQKEGGEIEISKVRFGVTATPSRNWVKV
jgi:hypothetical protein